MEDVVGEIIEKRHVTIDVVERREGVQRKGSKETKKEGDRPIKRDTRPRVYSSVYTGVPRAIHAPYSLIPYSKARK